MPMQSDGTFARIWKFVDQYIAGDNALRTAFDASFDDLTVGVNAALDRKAIHAQWDASSGAFPSGSFPYQSYIVTVAGTVDGVPFAVDDVVIALVRNASTTTFSANWRFLERAGGPVVFATKAAANAALDGLANGDVVDVEEDESRGHYHTRYRVSSGSLAFQKMLEPYRVYDAAPELLLSDEPSRAVGSIWRGGGFRYEELASGATDEHVTNAAGVKFYVLPGERGYHVDAFGAAGDGTTNDTAVIQAAAAATGDGEAFQFDGAKSYVLQGAVDTAGTTLGKKCYLNGATLLLNDNAATIKIGQQGSGLFLDGGTIRPQSGFTGTAVTITPQARSTSAARSVHLNHGNIVCATATGKAIDMTVDTAETRIVGLRSFGLTIAGFEFGVDLNSAAPSGVGFVNDNEFHGLRLPFNTANGVRLQASSSGTNETSGNMFVGLMTQWVSGVTVKSINVADTRCKRNKFISVETWDISGASGVSEVVTDLGTSTMWLGSVPSSGGVSSLSPSAIGMRTKDAGSQLAELLLGDYVRSNSVETRKIQTFDTADLTILDVRDGDIMIEGTVASGTRLTNIIQGGTGQIITIIFGGNTLLSNEWGGVGDIKLKNGGSRYPAPNEVCQFVYNGTDWIELGGKDEQLTSAVAGAISNIANAINTTGKFTGKLVWDSTNNRMLRASGASASSVWHVVDGSASVTPA